MIGIIIIMSNNTRDVNCFTNFLWKSTKKPQTRKILQLGPLLAIVMSRDAVSDTAIGRIGAAKYRVFKHYESEVSNK